MRYQSQVCKSKAAVGGKRGLGFPNTILSKWLCGSTIAILLFLPFSSPQIVSEILKGLLPKKRTRTGKGGLSKEEEELEVKRTRDQGGHLSESCSSQIL